LHQLVFRERRTGMQWDCACRPAAKRAILRVATTHATPRALADSRRLAWCSLCAGEHSAFDEAAAVRATPSRHDDQVAGNPFATERNYPVLRSYCRVDVATQGLLF
jgi:hypothetical protein